MIMGNPINSKDSIYPNIIASREDISEYLFHFTKGKEAISTLKNILSQQSLKKGEKNPICFTETPLFFLPKMFELFIKSYPHNPMYAPYGIGFKKDYIFALGGRPAIYWKKEEMDLLPEELKWRFVEYNHNYKDFTWLREWRINIPELFFDKNDCIIITRNEAQLFELTQEEGELEEFIIDYIKDGQYIIESHQARIPMKHYKGVNLECINEWCQTKQDLNDLLSWQEIFNIDK